MNILRPSTVNFLRSSNKSLSHKVQRNFFQKIFEEAKKHHNSEPLKIVQKLNQDYNPEYLNNEFVKYVNQIGVPPLNSYNIVNPRIAETDFFSQKTIFRIAAQAQFRRWMDQYESLVDSLVAGDMNKINKLCEERLCQKFETFLEKLEKSQLKFSKITPLENLDIMAYPEYQYHRQVEGVSLNRRLNYHESQYVKTQSKEKLIFKKLNEKKQSKWALLNLSDDQSEKENNTDELVLNQYLISFQTNIRLNLVRKADETEIVYGSNDRNLIAVHFIQIENVRNHFQETDYYITDIDNILNGNPFVTS
ncbi:hypothetical protein TTHERM_00691910 (macronuclear) [Tetrahymena thermophila SB210]|uniref:Uncharacterized protein n=1 Tax=Tetrahymena thermophila (strain SB210) TaxID=312017 RepID=I7MFY5_TETTS|nr:hypothetical protein TTHERM_00691910 [Tetrahymena thermophila SB210]EAR84493.1 hypothetical protein TTHERM_00691910 [Tetrahymena thermophila SB210]|eukprot:XP_001032156.1 hypothetical protein TTHERM_00691910 [Tetrahymena thermophila SB210]